MSKQHAAAFENNNKDSSVDSSTIFIIALINIKSGAGIGQKALNILSQQPNCRTINILDFATDSEKIRKEHEENLSNLIDKNKLARIVIGGGDGTITQGFEILSKIDKNPPVAVLPLGTANEFSRCTGQKKTTKAKHIEKFCNRVRSGKLFNVDVQNIQYFDNPIDKNNTSEIDCNIPSNSSTIERPKTMIAFLSIGFDASIAYKFQQKRVCFKSGHHSSHIRSKLSYVRYGFNEVLKPSCRLNNQISLFTNSNLDEPFSNRIDLPSKSIRSLQILNIGSMADGVNLFGTSRSSLSTDLLQEGSYKAPKLNDSLLEVVASKSIHHMNNVRLGIGHSIRIAQVQGLEIVLDRCLPVEVDGEPFMNPPGRIRIVNGGKRRMVLGPKFLSKSLHKAIQF